MISYKKLETISWAKKPVVILGAGPSLISYDFTACSCHMIVVNSAILKTKWDREFEKDILRAWISNDSLCRKWSYFDKVKSDFCYKIVRDSWAKYADELKDFIFFKPRKTREDIIEENDDGLLYNSSVPSAIDLAIKIGFNEIYLFGIDHTVSGEKTHFWQFLPKHIQPKEKIISNNRTIFAQPTRIMQPVPMQKNVWNMNIEVFKSLSNYAKTKNVNIFNINDSSTLIPFEHKHLSNTDLINYGVKHMPISKYS
jgi:hypothetical protein